MLPGWKFLLIFVSIFIMAYQKFEDNSCGNFDLKDETY